MLPATARPGLVRVLRRLWLELLRLHAPRRARLGEGPGGEGRGVLGLHHPGDPAPEALRRPGLGLDLASAGEDRQRPRPTSTSSPPATPSGRRSPSARATTSGPCWSPRSPERPPSSRASRRSRSHEARLHPARGRGRARHPRPGADGDLRHERRRGREPRLRQAAHRRHHARPLEDDRHRAGALRQGLRHRRPGDLRRLPRRGLGGLHLEGPDPDAAHHRGLAGQADRVALQPAPGQGRRRRPGGAPGQRSGRRNRRGDRQPLPAPGAARLLRRTGCLREPPRPPASRRSGRSPGSPRPR